MENIKECKKIEELIVELKNCNRGDNEVVHIIYDEILKEIAKEYEPKIVKKIDRITKDITFWHA